MKNLCLAFAQGPLTNAWPIHKKQAGQAVDYKICHNSQIWSAALFFHCFTSQSLFYFLTMFLLFNHIVLCTFSALPDLHLFTNII